MTGSFNQSRIPFIRFGPGKRSELPSLVRSYGDTCLILTGKRSFPGSPHWEDLLHGLKKNNITHFHEIIRHEPSPEIIDRSVQKYSGRNIRVIVSIGGGSVLDAGKAISAMLMEQGPVMDFLEEIGHRKPSGAKIPFIAVPTTSGTGSETTKNAVISKVGPLGFKKSLRHDRYVPDVSVVDPELTLTCPAETTAACGMDTFTQLLESYTAPTSTPFTDALAFNALKYVINAIQKVYHAPHDLRARTHMAYGSMISGITLANAGLGLVHGFASPIGGSIPIPHGVVCGTLMGTVTKFNIHTLCKGAPEHPALKKYAATGMIFDGNAKKDPAYYHTILLDKIFEMTRRFNIPRLGAYGLSSKDLDSIVERTGHKNNPAHFSKTELKQMLNQRL